MHKVKIAPSAEGDLLDGYEFDGSTATIAAVIDARRNPKIIRRTLADRH